MNYEKLSSTLAVLMFEYENSGGEDFLSIQPSRPQAVSDSENGSPQAKVFVHCDENANFENLPGIRVNSAEGKIRTARVELKKIGELSDMPGVQHLSSSMRLKPLYDFQAIDAGLRDFQSNHSNLMTENAVIGIIDTGINAALPIFANRIHSIWDQEAAGEGSGTVKYGKVLNEGAFQESADFDGHGTNAAKMLIDYFTTESVLVVVKTDFQTAHIADGVRYIFETAEKLGKPAVICLNTDGHFDVQDGADDLSAFIAQETGAGKFVVSANGNDESRNNHFTETIAPNIFQPKKIKFVVPPNNQPGSPPQIVLRGWFEAAGNCEISIMSPNGMTTKSTQEATLDGNPTRNGKYFTSQAFLTVPTVSSPISGKKDFYIDLRPLAPKQLVAGGKWQLTIKNIGDAAVNVNIFSWVPEKPKDIKFL